MDINTALVTGLAALKLTASDEQRGLFLYYLELINKWNRVYNLTAVQDVRDMLGRHLMDSLSVAPVLHRVLQPHTKLLDVGSGAGLPGVVLAILFPEVSVVCVDAVGKKTGFIKQVALELRLKNLQAEHARVETLPNALADVIISRAFANLTDFTTLTYKHLKNSSAVWVAMKGKLPLDEIANLPSTVDMFHVEHLHVPNLNAERCLVWMRPKSP